MLRRSSRGGVPGLQPAPAEPEGLQRLRQAVRRRLAGAPGRPLLAPDVDQAVEERAGRDDQRPAAQMLVPSSSASPGDPPAVEHDALGLAEDPVDAAARARAPRATQSL